MKVAHCQAVYVHTTEFDVHVIAYRDKFLYYNQLDVRISHIYLWSENLHVSDSSSVHHQEFFTVHTAMVYIIQFSRQLSSRIRMEHPDPARKLSPNRYDVYHCFVYSEKLLMMDRGTVRNM